MSPAAASATSDGSGTSTPPPALTTTFTPAASCTDNFYKYPYHATGTADDEQCYYGSSVVDCQFFHLGHTTSDAACMPSGWEPASSVYFSPGLCPVGYTEACKASVGTETIATCCPSGYSCQTAASMPWMVTDICASEMPESQFFSYTDMASESATVSHVYDQQGINAFGLRIRYQASDFPTTSSMPATTTATTGTVTGSGGGSGSNTHATQTAAPTGSNSTGSSGLSTGAKAGVGVGASLGALALIAAVVFAILGLRKKRAGATQTTHIPMGPGPGAGVAYTAVPGNTPAPPYSSEYKYGYTSPTPSPAGYQQPSPAGYPQSPPPPPPPPQQQQQQYAEVAGDTAWSPPTELAASR